MSLADELMKLQQLRDSGALSEAEFSTAKDRLLHPSDPAGDASATGTDEAHPRTAWTRTDSDDLRYINRLASAAVQGDEDNSLGRAANRYVSYQAVFGVIGLIIVLVIILGFFIPLISHMGDHQSPLP